MEGIGNIFCVKQFIDNAAEKMNMSGRDSSAVEDLGFDGASGIGEAGIDSQLRRKLENLSKSCDVSEASPQSDPANSFQLDNASQKFVLNFLQNYLYRLMESVGHSSEMVCRDITFLSALILRCLALAGSLFPAFPST